MKKYILMLAMFLISFSLHAQWEKVNTPGVMNMKKIFEHEGNLYLTQSLKSNVYMSSDKGKSWEKKFRVNEHDYEVTDLLFSGDTILAGTDKGGLYISYNAGKSWLLWNNTFMTVYQIVKMNDIIFVATSYGLFKLIDYGETWTEIFNNGEVILPSTMTAAGDTLYLGSVVNKGIMISSDNGESWQHITDGLGIARKIIIRDDKIFVMDRWLRYSYKDEYNWTPVEDWPHRDYDMFLAPFGEKFAAFSRALGVYVSDASGNVWKHISDNIHPSITNDVLAVGDTLYVSTTDGVYVTTDEGETWSISTTGLAGDVMVLDVKVNNGDIYTSVYRNGIYKSTDLGENWQQLLTNVNTKSFGDAYIDNNSLLTSSILIERKVVFVPDLNKPEEVKTKVFDNFYIIGKNTIYKNKLFVTNRPYLSLGKDNLGIYMYENTNGDWSDFETNWEMVDSNETSRIVPSGDTLYACTIDKGLRISYDDGDTWESLVNSLYYYNMEKFKYTGLSIYNLGINDNYMLTQVQDSGLYISYDRGFTWEIINKSFNFTSVSDYYFSGDTVIMSTSYGVYFSPDRGKTLTLMNEGLEREYSYGLAVYNNTAYLANINGIYKRDLIDFISGVGSTVSTPVKSALYVYPPYPNPAKSEVSMLIVWTGRQDFDISSTKVYNYRGEEVADASQMSFVPESMSSGYLSWRCSGINPGVYIIKVLYGGEIVSSKIIIE